MIKVKKLCHTSKGDDMKIGYACTCIDGFHTNYRTCIQRFATVDKLEEIIQYNLTSFLTILEYNASHHISMYRIPSDLIPFGSSPVNTLPWRTLFHKEFLLIGKFIKIHHMRVSLHPGQYSVLNSPRKDVVERAIEDVLYHVAILDTMDLDFTHKVVLHVGGVYGDKDAAVQRFINIYYTLPDIVKRRLVIENDDHFYHIEDVLNIANKIHAPVIFDNLHHAILAPKIKKTEVEWLDAVKQTWKQDDGVPKLHYCVQDCRKRIGAHAFTILSVPFLSFVKQLEKREIDIMLEVKDKNLSAIKCLNLMQGYIKHIDEEWNRYHYVLYLHKAKFQKWKVLLDKGETPTALLFYEDIENIYASAITLQQYIDVATYIYQEGCRVLQEKDLRLYTRQFTRFIQRDVTWVKLLEQWFQFFQKRQIYQFCDALYPLMNTYEIEV